MKNSVKNRICRLLALILSLVAVIAVTPVAVPAAVTYDDVKTDDTEELRRRLEKMTEESNALAAKIKSAEQSEADALARKELYDQMHNLYIEQLTVLEGQMAALEAWCVGKTVEEVVAGAADDVDLKAGCTVGIDSQLVALQKAAAAAK